MAMSGGGAIAIGPVFPKGEPVPRIIGVRYDMHIERAAPVTGKARGIVFNGKRLAGPMGSPYLPEVSLFQWWPDVTAGVDFVATPRDIGCQGWPPKGRLRNAPSLWTRLTDYNDHDRSLIGLRASTARTRRVVGIQNAGIDNIAGITCIDAAFQGSVEGLRARITLQRGVTRNVTGPRAGFGHRFERTPPYECREGLIPDTYTTWETSIEEDQATPRAQRILPQGGLSFETLVPQRYGDHIASWEPCSFVAEFIDRCGPLVIHYSNPCYLEDGVWMPLRWWQLHYTARPSEPIEGYGWQSTKPGVLTLTNDGGVGYPKYRDILDIYPVRADIRAHWPSQLTPSRASWRPSGSALTAR